MRVPPDQSSHRRRTAPPAPRPDRGARSARRDVGQPRAEQEHRDALARVRDRMQEMQEQPRVVAHRAGDIEQRHDRRRLVARGRDISDSTICAAACAGLPRRVRRRVETAAPARRHASAASSTSSSGSVMPLRSARAPRRSPPRSSARSPCSAAPPRSETESSRRLRCSSRRAPSPRLRASASLHAARAGGGGFSRLRGIAPVAAARQIVSRSSSLRK